MYGMEQQCITGNDSTFHLHTTIKLKKYLCSECGLLGEDDEILA